MNVSVMVCTYGTEEWRRRGQHALESALAQAPEPFEAFALHHPDGTLAQVRNAAAIRAAGDWLCLLDADDELAPGYLSTITVAERNRDGLELALLVPAVQYVGGVGYETVPEIPAWGRPLEEINCACIGTLVPRDLFLRVGGFQEWPIYEDWDLWLRCVKAGASLVPVPGAVYRATVTDGSRNAVGATLGTLMGQVAVETYAAIRAAHGY